MTYLYVGDINQLVAYEIMLSITMATLNCAELVLADPTWTSMA